MGVMPAPQRGLRERPVSSRSYLKTNWYVKIDVLPADVIPAGKVMERLSSHQMVLDLLLDEGIPVAFSEPEVSTAG
jgi:hypothetical protein